MSDFSRSKLIWRTGIPQKQLLIWYSTERIWKSLDVGRAARLVCHRHTQTRWSSLSTDRSTCTMRFPRTWNDSHIDPLVLHSMQNERSVLHTKDVIMKCERLSFRIIVIRLIFFFTCIRMWWWCMTTPAQFFFFFSMLGNIMLWLKLELLPYSNLVLPLKLEEAFKWWKISKMKHLHMTRFLFLMFIS